jgi:hypothetical protein
MHIQKSVLLRSEYVCDSDPMALAIAFCIDTKLYIHLINITHPMAVLICGHPWSDGITWMIIDQCVPTKLTNLY